MAATFIITDGGATLDVKIGTARERSMLKDNIIIDILPGDDLVVLIHSDESINLDWKLVTSPTVISAKDLKDKLVAMLASGSGTGSATSANQVIGNNALSAIQSNTDTPIEADSVGGGVTYLGFAAPGANRASAIWKIKRVTEINNDATIEFADGDDSFDNVWNDRTGLSYS